MKCMPLKSLIILLMLPFGTVTAQESVAPGPASSYGLDILDAEEQSLFRELSALEPCPCPGDVPRSLGTCLEEPSVCPLAREVAWLMFRHIKEDASPGEIQDQVTRFITEATTPRTFALENTPMRGSARALVQLVVFSDFECPHCQRFVETGEQLAEEFGDQIAVYYKHFPIPMHANAMSAARAANAAGRQDHFWAMHDALFHNQTHLQNTRNIDAFVLELAGDLGLDTSRFAADYRDPAVQLQAERDRDEGRAAGVNSTPTLYINGLLYNDIDSFEGLRTHIQSLLEGSTPN